MAIRTYVYCSNSQNTAALSCIIGFVLFLSLFVSVGLSEIRIFTFKQPQLELAVAIQRESAY